jgi:hypothetical protein
MESPNRPRPARHSSRRWAARALRCAPLTPFDSLRSLRASRASDSLAVGPPSCSVWILGSLDRDQGTTTAHSISSRDLPSDGPGIGRQDMVRDDADRDRLVEHVGRAAVRCSWRVFAFVIMSCQTTSTWSWTRPNQTGPEECRASSRHMPALGLGPMDLTGMYSKAVVGRNWWKMRPMSGLSRANCISILSRLDKSRAAMACLVRGHAAATNGELTEILGTSCAENVPNPTRRFEAWLSNDSWVRKQLTRLEDKLNWELPAE